MKMRNKAKVNSLNSTEKKSIELLMNKMGMSRKEVQHVSSLYGVSAAQLLELMQLSKYHFVYNGKVPGQCESYPVSSVKMRAVNY